jgi:hypothetical protein
LEAAFNSAEMCNNLSKPKIVTKNTNFFMKSIYNL